MGMLHEPGWVEYAIWWHIFPLGFTGVARQRAETEDADPTDPTDPTDEPCRLSLIIDWLDYAVELGTSGLLLGPVFASETHGYDTVDYLRVDSRLGTEEDLLDLFDQAHRRGLRVLLDGVFNHVGRGFPRFGQALRDGPGSESADWFTFYWPDQETDRPGQQEPGYEMFEGHPGLVTLNHANPSVAHFVSEVMRHWLDRGADGWRLDAAYAVPTGFWADVLGRIRGSHPDAYLVGEVIHGDYPALVEETGLHALTQYELWKAVRSSINDRNLYELAHAVQRHDEFLDTFVPLTFLGNHDVTRLASALTDHRHLPHAVAVLMLLGGTPSIYYGDERGWRGVKEDRPGGDDAVRPAFGSPEGQPLGADERAVWDLHRELIGLRRRHPWLHRSRSRVPHLTNEVAVIESGSGDDRLLLGLNLSDEAATLPMAGGARVLAGRAHLDDPGGSACQARIEGHGWAVVGPEA